MRNLLSFLLLVTSCQIVIAQPVKPVPAAVVTTGHENIGTSLYVPGKKEVVMISHNKAWMFSTDGKLLRGPFLLRQDGGDAWYPRVSENGRYISFFVPGAGFMTGNDRVALFDIDSNFVTGTYKLPMSSDLSGMRFSGDSILLFHTRFLDYEAMSIWLTREGKMKHMSFSNDSIPSGMYDLTYYGKQVVGVARYADSLSLVCVEPSAKEFSTTILLSSAIVRNHVQVTKGKPFVIIGDESTGNTSIYGVFDTSFQKVAQLPYLPVIHASAGSAEGCFLLYQDTASRGQTFILYNSSSNEEIILPFQELLAEDHTFEIFPGQQLFTASHSTDGTIRAYSLGTGLPLWVVSPKLPAFTGQTISSSTTEDNSLFKVMIKQGTENVTASWFDQPSNQLLLVKNNNKLVTVDAESKCAVKYEQFYRDNGSVKEVRLAGNNRYILYSEEKWKSDPENADDPEWKKTFYQYPYAWKVFDRKRAQNILEINAGFPMDIYTINDSIVAWASGGYLAGTDSMQTFNLVSGESGYMHPLPGSDISGLKTAFINDRSYFLAKTYEDDLFIANDKGKSIFKSDLSGQQGSLDKAHFVKNSPYVYFEGKAQGKPIRLYKIDGNTVAPVRVFPRNISILASKATPSGCYFLYRKEFERKTGAVYHYRLIEMLSGSDKLIDSSDFDNPYGTYEVYPDQDFYVSIIGNVVTWHDLNSGYAFKDFGREEPTIVSLTYSPDGRYLAAANPHGKVMLWDLGTGRETKTLAVGSGGYITRLAFSGDGKYLAASSGDIWETASGKNVVSVTDRSIWEVNSIDFSIDGKRIISGGACIISWDGEDGSRITYQQEPQPEDMDSTGNCWNPHGCVKADYSFMVHSTAFHPNSRDFVTGNKSGILQKWNTDTKKMLAYKVLEYVMGQPDRKVYDLRYTRDGKYIIAVQERMLYRLDGDSLHVIDSLLLPEGEQVLAIDMGYDDRQFGCITSRNNVRLVQLRSIEGLTVQREFIADGASFNKLSFSPNKSHVATASDDGFCTIWTLSDGKPQVYLSTIGEYGNIMVTGDNYYMASRSALEGVTFYRDGSFYSFDQFDLYLNRPDIVLERLGYANPELLNFYRNAYLKRLKKAGGSMDTIPPASIPELKLLNRKALPLVTRSGKVALELQASDSNSPSGEIRVFVNGNLASEYTVVKDKMKVTDSVVLGQGLNNIEIVYRSAFGVESHKQKSSITYSPLKKTTPKTWFFGIGVSKYANASMNLKYPVKDIRDLAIAFKKKYPGLIIDTLLDGRVTKENILALREKLMKTSVDDRVFISFNGHGLLSDSLDWYFGTYDINPTVPATRGLAYAQMENLLQGIPARKKLLLLDACHSGEVDREKDITFANRETEMGTDVKATARGIIIKNKDGVGLQTSFELMQEIFANLNNGNGTTVLSAAGGTEYALESDAWKNGVFTYSLLKALSDPATDENVNKKISVRELKKAVFKSVRTLTGGRQKPTSRVEVLDDWEL